MFNNFLTQSLSTNKSFNASGFKQLYLIRKDNIVSLTRNASQIVNQITVVAGTNFNSFQVENGSFVYSSELTKNGVLYTSEISFNISKTDVQKFLILDSLLNTEVTAIVKDYNGKLWMVGHKTPLQGSYNSKVDNDNNNYQVNLAGKQINRIEEVLGNYVVGIGVKPQDETEGQVDPIVDEELNPFPTVTGSSSGGTGTNNIFMVVHVTSNYNIKNGDSYLKVDAGLSVYLPALPAIGQLHIIKDWQGQAEEFPIEIFPVNATIDDDLEARIDSNYGAFELIYQGAGKWSITALVI